MTPRGHVALVGAGPGDPALLTLRAAELIRAADVVAHDELISDAILAMVPARAELLPVGRRIGAGELAHRLHPEVKERALRGLRVVRLKAGDPLIFGRGGEEAEELVEAGIPFEIVPGITAAVGAAAFAGIPLTHRGCSAQVTITSGHRVDGGLPPPAILGGRSLVLYMAAHELQANLDAVIASGWPPSTPAALVASATSAEQRVIQATLATLAARSREASVPRAKEPAVVIVGDVVELRGALAWRERLPLFGQNVVVARARAGVSELGRRLRDLGAIVMELPHIDRGGSAVLPRTFEAAEEGDLLLLSSVEAVEAWLDAAWSLPVIALGSDVAALVASAGRTPVHTLRGACADAIQEARAHLEGRRVFIPLASAGTSLLEPLRSVGAKPVTIALAVQKASPPARWPAAVDAVVLASSLAALALYAQAPEALLQVPAIAIGPQSAAQATRCGARDVRTAPHDSLEALVSCVLQTLAPGPSEARPRVPTHRVEAAQ